MYNKYYANVTEAVATGEREVTFHFDQKGNRELPKIMGDLVVLPKHWWEGTDARARSATSAARPWSRRSAPPPTRSPASSRARRSSGSACPTTGAAQLPVKIGRENFDKRRYTYFLDDNAAWQAFAKGGFQDIRPETSARRWATEYNFPAIKAGDVIKAEYPTTSRPADAGLCHELAPAAVPGSARAPGHHHGLRLRDHEPQHLLRRLQTHRQLFRGRGTGLQRHCRKARNSRSSKPTATSCRRNCSRRRSSCRSTTRRKRAARTCAQALQLFKEAGWVNRGGKLVNEKTGEQFRIEFLGNDPVDERVATPFIDSLRRLGIDATLRIIDESQYINRIRSFDFDMLALATFGQSQSPGNEQRDFFSSKAADTPGSRNLAGIKDPVVDALVDRVIFATDRDDLVAATHALDRVLLWNYYMVPQWHLGKVRLAYWNKFGIPEKQPSYVGVDIDSWWIDKDKEAALAARYK